MASKRLPVVLGALSAMYGWGDLTGAAAVALAAPPDPLVFKDDVSCKKTGLTFAYTIRIADCRIRSEGHFSAKVEDVQPSLGSLRGDFVYEVDLTRPVALASKPALCDEVAENSERDPNQDSVREVSLEPAKLMSKRVYAMSGNERIDRDDVPLFGEEETKLRLFVDVKEARKLTSAINAARDRCQTQPK